jgi:glycerate-2-kinase
VQWLKIIYFANQYTGNIPAAIVIGGETTVVVKCNGKGGRNQHLALSALIELFELGNHTKHTITLLSAGTDGTDGPTDAAGAIIGKATYKLMNDVELLPNEYLSNNDSYNFFNQINGLLRTGQLKQMLWIY